MRIFIIALALASLVFAYDGAGTADFQELRLACEARALGMGEAYTAMAEGVSALNWNPAGIAVISRPEILLAYRDLPLDVQGGIPAYAGKFRHHYGFAAGAQYLNYGSFTEIDGDNNVLGTMPAPFSFVGIAGAAKKINKRLFAGAAIKGIYQKLGDDYAPKGAGMDVGIRYLPDFRKTSIGLVVQNAGLHAWDYSFTLPLVYKAGITTIFPVFPKTRFALDVVKPVTNVFDYRMGMEFRHSRNLCVRAGYSITQPELEQVYKKINSGDESDAGADRLQSWSLGAGYKTNAFEIDYAVQSWQMMGLTHAVSMLFHLGGR